MRKIKYLLLMTLFYVAINETSAQLNYGVSLGGNLSTINQDFFDVADELPTKQLPGLNLGLVLDYPLSEGMSISSGLYYSAKGTAFDIEEIINDPAVTVKGHYRSRVNYLELPVDFNYNMNSFSLMAGVYYAIGLKGFETWDFDITDAGVTENEAGLENYEFSNEIIDGNNMEEIKGSDFGFNLGAKYKLDPVSVGIKYSIGLTNLNPLDPTDLGYDPDSEKFTNRNLSVFITYMF